MALGSSTWLHQCLGMCPDRLHRGTVPILKGQSQEDKRNLV